MHTVNIMGATILDALSREEFMADLSLQEEFWEPYSKTFFFMFSFSASKNFGIIVLGEDK